MKNNLGKIFIICIFFLTGLFADVKLTVNSPAIYEGELASFTITSTSDGDIEFPNINSIDKYNIVDKSSSQSTTIINGNYSKKISRTLEPNQHFCHFECFLVVKPKIYICKMYREL